MTNEEVAGKILQHDIEIKHHAEQISALQDNQKTLQDMATSIAVMAKDQKTLTNKVDAVIAKVDVLEGRPGKRWDALITALIGALVGIFIGIVMKGGV